MHKCKEEALTVYNQLSWLDAPSQSCKLLRHATRVHCVNSGNVVLKNPNEKLEQMDCPHDVQLYIFECDVKEDVKEIESESDRKIRRVLVCTVASAFTLGYSTWIQKICRTKHGQLHQLNQKVTMASQMQADLFVLQLVLFCAEDVNCNLDIAKCNDAQNLYKLDIEASEGEWKGRLVLGSGTKRAKTTLLHRSLSRAPSTFASQQIPLANLARAQSTSGSDNHNHDSEDLVDEGTYGCTIYMHDRAEPASTDICTDTVHDWMHAFGNCKLRYTIDGEVVEIRGESFEESASGEEPQNEWFSRNDTKQHPACAGAEPEATAEAATEAKEGSATKTEEAQWLNKMNSIQAETEELVRQEHELKQGTTSEHRSRSTSSEIY